MKKSMTHAMQAGAVAAAVVLFASQAKADCNHQPGLLAYLSQAMSVRTSTPCTVYQGDYMVKQGPTYDGPAVIAPQATYAQAPTASGYPYVHGQYGVEPEPAVRVERKRVTRRATVPRTKRVAVRRQAVNVKSDLPPRKGKIQIVHARAEVRIYGPERMDIKLYRR